ncbi:MAG TPA: 23S rRNA (pseudouridine(1915)-N(3))-methyltransferase RlmH [Coprothermobacter sp.]|nr:23S rRNA (pseudouridine(1915)-N(3))-methyltransferase RlmH [Coprothermobacter sp.]
MRVHVVAVGKLKKHYVAEGVKDYLNRIRHYISLSMVETKEEDPFNIIDKEGFHIILDAQGQSMTSEEFASFVDNLLTTRSEDVFFYIGGPEGFSEKFKNKAQMQISLSPMTFPHELARLFFLEQLYRALTIIKGEKYHK